MGCSPFGHAYGSPDEAAAMKAVDAAFKSGVNFFDVAPFYASGDAERLLGRAIKHLPRDQIIVATKLKHIDLIQVHDIEFAEDMRQIVNETIPALQKLKEQGLVRFIGITGYPLDIYTYVLDRVPAGAVDTILSYCHNNLADQTLLDLLPYLHEKGVGVISASFSSMGLLRKEGPPDWHPAPAAVKEAASKAAKHAQARGTDLAKLAITEFVRTPGISLNLMGMATPQEVETDVQIVLEALGIVPSKTAALEAEVLPEVQKIMKPVMNTTWKTGLQDNRK
ncbi:hypothetical protein WJX77_002726 [Trebouxia sp. C0004]